MADPVPVWCGPQTPEREACRVRGDMPEVLREACWDSGDLLGNQG